MFEAVTRALACLCGGASTVEDFTPAVARRASSASLAGSEHAPLLPAAQRASLSANGQTISGQSRFIPIGAKVWKKTVPLPVSGGGASNTAPALSPAPVARSLSQAGSSREDAATVHITPVAAPQSPASWGSFARDYFLEYRHSPPPQAETTQPRRNTMGALVELATQFFTSLIPRREPAPAAPRARAVTTAGADVPARQQAVPQAPQPFLQQRITAQPIGANTPQSPIFAMSPLGTPANLPS